MFKRYSFWLWFAVILQFVTGVIHSISLFVKQVPQNDTERSLLELMTTYRIDLGGGYLRTMGQLFTALSSCFSLLCLLAGLTLAFLLRRKAPLDILRGVAGINMIVFLITFCIMVAFAFLPPIVLTGLIVATLGAGFMLLRSA